MNAIRIFNRTMEGIRYAVVVAIVAALIIPALTLLLFFWDQDDRGS